MNEWKKVKLGDCIKEVVDKTTQNNQYEVLSVTKDGIFSQKEFFKKQIASENNIGYKIIRKNNLVFSTMNLWMGSLDVLTNFEIGIVSPAYKIFEFNQKIMLPQYANYFMKSHYMLEQYKNYSEQGASIVRRSLDLKGLLDIYIYIPSIEKQKKIVKILNEVNCIIDRLSKKSMYTKLQKKYVENILFSEGLENKSNLQQVSEKWVVKRLNEITDYVDYRGKTPKKVDNGIRLITAKNIKKGYIDYEIAKEYINEEQFENIMRRGKVAIGDILITTEAPCGNVAQVDNEKIALAQRVIKYTGKENVILNSFLKYYMLGDKFQNELHKLSTGGTAQGIKGSVLHRMQISFPSINKQRKIVEVLDKFEYIIRKVEQQVDYYKNIKCYLMQQLLTGKVKI